MLKKTLSASQKIILLRSFCMLLALIVVVIPLVSPVSASGSYDFWDMNPTLLPDGENTLIKVNIPVDLCYSYVDVHGGSDIAGGSEIYCTIPSGVSADFCFYPFGYPWDGLNNLSLHDIPNGTAISFVFDMSLHPAFYNTDILGRIRYYDANGNYFADQDTIIKFTSGNIMQFDIVLNIPYRATSFSFMWVNSIADGAGSTFSYKLLSTTLSMTLDSVLVQQQQTGRTNSILQKVEQQLADQGKTLEDVLKEQQDTNDKLDKLPGQIGDEMQGVIENEKEESKSEGNKFVDQILDALPDPSTEVLAALKDLTDATSYTGTDAILPIPAIVLPGIDGLFLETVIWGGTNFDFGEYISFLPPSLLTLVQSLFTIAIVLFCVYELKGIISYCLTLRESKGG